MANEVRRVGVVLFDQFELLDVFGPLEMFGLCKGHFEIVLIGPEVGPVASAQGPRSIVDYSYLTAPTCDIVLVPGGRGTRPLVNDEAFLAWLVSFTKDAAFVTSVCTGSALLAKSGLLNGRRATSNKLSFAWVTSQSDDVIWEPSARWVEDGNLWTSSGVSAGIDMALALIAHLHGTEMAGEVAMHAEYEWHRDATVDPFAVIHDILK